MSKDYYPGIEIDLNRNIDDKSISDGGSGDVRNWDGGIYFESKLPKLSILSITLFIE